MHINYFVSVVGLAAAVLSPHAWSQPVEPGAGGWKTWVISSGKDYRVLPPPGVEETQGELNALADLLAHGDAGTRDVAAYWDAGAPTYRWMDYLNNRIMANTPTTAYAHRVYAYMALAMYDATIAAWESKYAYNRARPSVADNRVKPLVDVPQSPSYPSEHSATAAAAAAVLAYFLPNEAAGFQASAEQAGWSRVLAGVQYPSDHLAGLELGRAVAQKVIDKAKADGSDAVWTGTVPVGPCNWIGTNPPNVTAPGWKPLLLSAPNQFRPDPPPSCTSPEVIAQATAVKTYARTFVTNYKAFYWQSPEGLNVWPYRYADKWIAEDKLDRNPPRAARAYAMIAAVLFDAFIASQDGKFTYWYIRPHQLDPGITPLFAVPPFPSYPSNHSTFSSARGEVLAYLFPTRAAFARATAKEGGDSRIWAGIHYEMDNAAGVKLGKSVADVFITRAKGDGS